jgi:cytochrome c oxidase assembly factor CtaG
VNVAWWCSSTPGQIWTWRYTPFLGVWVVGASFIGGYVLAHRRAGRPLDRRLTRRFVGGVLALMVVSEWPIGQLGVGYLATVGIARYVVYTFVAAPLLVAGLPTWLIDRWFPLDSRRGRTLTVLTRWPVALLLFNAVLFGTHVPITVDTLKVTQLGSFAVDVLHLSAAVLWWWPAIRREPERGAIHEPIRAFYLFTTSVLMFVPAAFLTFSPLPLYGLYELAPPLWLGFDPVLDQQAAGITMNVIGGLVLWGIIATLFLRWAKEQADDDEQTRRARDARVLQRMAVMADEEPSTIARADEDRRTVAQADEVRPTVPRIDGPDQPGGGVRT